MGWASYIEDLITRYEDSLHMAETIILDDKVPPEFAREKASKSLLEAKAIWAEIAELLDDVTNPDLNLAVEVSNLKKNFNDQKSEIGWLKSSLTKERGEKEKLREEISYLNRLVQSLESEKEDIRNQFLEKIRSFESEKEQTLKLLHEEKEKKVKVENRLALEKSLTPEMFDKYGNKD